MLTSTTIKGMLINEKKQNECKPLQRLYIIR
jgi:hypothetical protein